MSRFNSSLLLVLVVVLVSTFHDANALAPVVRNVRRATSVHGRIGDRVESSSPSSSSSSTYTMPALSSQQNPTPINRDMGEFDPDAYRREMTELVYRRNLDRGFSS